MDDNQRLTIPLSYAFLDDNEDTLFEAGVFVSSAK